MKSKIKKLKEHSCIEYQFTYTFNGEVIKRKVRLIDAMDLSLQKNLIA